MSTTPNTVRLIVELGPESMAKLDEVLEALKGLQGGTVTNVVNQVKADPAPVREDEPPFDTAASEEDEEPDYTKADVQKLVQKLAAPDSPKREQAKAIVKKYGAKISAIPPEKYPEVMRKLKKLDAATE